jgi:HEAT repeat protein
MLPEADRNFKRRNDPRSTQELIRIALTEQDEDAAWDPVISLQVRGTAEVLITAQSLCTSAVARERKLGADILGQLGIPERSFPEECFQTLRAMLATENEACVLRSIGVAFSHLHDPRAVELLAPLKDHPHEDVRFGVVFGVSGHDRPLAIRTLIELSSDQQSDVRDWATFYLGSELLTDSEDIRSALLARLTDPDMDTRAEAMAGLAMRKDPRVLSTINEELQSEDVVILALESAEQMADPRLLPALLQLKEAWAGNKDRHADWLHRAIDACSPSSISRDS